MGQLKSVTWVKIASAPTGQRRTDQFLGADADHSVHYRGPL